MSINTEELVSILGGKITGSPFLSVMIVNKKYQIVWHNQRFADEFNNGAMIENSTCFHSIGSDKVHDGCPLQKSLKEQITIRGFLDFGDRNFLFLTIPIDEEHAAKVHIFLPKEADNIMEEK